MKPGDLLLGVLDFFAILLPGSLATWLIVQYIPASRLRVALSFGLGDGQANPDAFVLGAAFLLASYMFGHFVFMAGGQIDVAYDRWRTRAKPTQRDTTFQAARALQTQLAKELVDGDFTTLKWARTYVQIKSPQSRIEIDRLEADSKFFRSMVVVCVAFAGHFSFHERIPVVVAIALIMAGLSYGRYRQQRWKMTELTYATAVVAHAAGKMEEGALIAHATGAAEAP